MTSRAQVSDAKRMVQLLNSNERVALELFTYGASIRRVANTLSVTEDEAREIKSSLMNKLGASATVELVRIGLLAAVME